MAVVLPGLLVAAGCVGAEHGAPSGETSSAPRDKTDPRVFARAEPGAARTVPKPKTLKIDGPKRETHLEVKAVYKYFYGIEEKNTDGWNRYFDFLGKHPVDSNKQRRIFRMAIDAYDHLREKVKTEASPSPDNPGELANPLIPRAVNVFFDEKTNELVFTMDHIDSLAPTQPKEDKPREEYPSRDKRVNRVVYSINEGGRFLKAESTTLSPFPSSKPMDISAIMGFLKVWYSKQRLRWLGTLKPNTVRWSKTPKRNF